MSGWGPALAWWLASLQLAGAAVLGLAAALDGLARRRSAATRRRVWALAIMLASTLPLARLALPAPALPAPAGLAGRFAAVWGLGVAALLLRWAHGVGEARRRVATARPIHAGPWRASLDALARESGADASAVELRLAPGLASPMIAGGRKATILIPAELADAPADERRAILTHELAHLTRADNLLLHLAALVRAIYWINPLAWWGLRRLRDAAEDAADDAVLEAGATPTSYAAQLVACARTQLDQAGRVAAGRLRPRVEAILDGSRRREPIEHRRPSLALARLLGLAALLASLATACEARSEPPQDEPAAADPRG